MSYIFSSISIICLLRGTPPPPMSLSRDVLNARDKSCLWFFWAVVGLCGWFWVVLGSSAF